MATSHAYNACGQRNSVFPINAVTGAYDRFGYNDEIGNVIRYFEVKSGNSWYGGLQKAKDAATEEITGIVIRVPGRP